MVDKQGWLRIVEAFVSVLIVFGAILTVTLTNRAPAQSVCGSVPTLLEEIAQKEELRVAVLEGKEESIKRFLEQRINNPSLNYEVRICRACLVEEENPCTADEVLCTHTQSGIDYAEICAGERVISDSVSTAGRQQFAPKKLKVFLFRI